MSFQAYQKRVVEEQADLFERIYKLTAFVNGDVFQSVDPKEQSRLIEQLGVMNQYNAILLDRIEAWEPPLNIYGGDITVKDISE